MIKSIRMGRVLLGLLLGLACASALAQTLRIGLQEDPDTLDPQRARTYVSRIVFTSLCDKLIDVDNKLQFVPQLAKSWSWSDGNKTLTFKLRGDVLFQDGTKFDAAAAKANFDREMTMPESMRKSEIKSIASVAAPDPTTLVLTLKHPDATLLAALSDRAGMMLSPASFQGKPVDAVAQHPVCSGPYKFVERVQNDRIVLQKFKRYYDAKDYHFDRVVFMPIPDSTVRLSNLRAGSLNMLERLNPADVPQVKQDSSLIFAPVNGLGFQELYFNVGNGPMAQKTPFKDPRVRKALELSIDRNAIDQVVGNGIFPPAGQPFPPASPYFSAKFAPPARDVAQAKALLKQAGVALPVKGTLSFGNNTTTSAMAQMIQAMAAEAGFNLTLQPVEYAALLSQTRQGNFEMALQGWSGRVDPDGNLTLFVACKASFNDGHYCNPQVDKLLTQAREVPDMAQRKALYEQAETILHQDEPNFYLYYQPWPFALQKKVVGFTPSPDGMIRLKGVHFAQ
ncbi:ABC transporter substrate-binding protein [Bordetella sp. FB-8]|uniref:ABC transporter substrate-binding protein n=1 Tax=Bordetella sp. FB-8 TaxID=1159870 RepID=UPI00037605AB|nr:ABC transporter substrate-binding protein [Bordetella sp. FB-8]